MSKQAYIDRSNFRAETLALIGTVNAIIDEYIAAGYRLTVRQLYYQCVARGIIENTMKSYKRMASIVNDGRLAGLIDWDVIEDRTRDFVKRSRWESGSQILEAVGKQFHKDMWHGQESRVFVIVEKEALAGVLSRVSHRFDVPLLAARGYPSSTVLREFCIEDIIPAVCDSDQRITILHLGDHDPSGIDMTRDLTERVALFCETTSDNVELERIALNWPQIEEHKPPPNPAKMTDSRYDGYVRLYGDESWELDALPPDYLDRLVTEHVQRHIDDDRWTETNAEIERVKRKIVKLAATFKD